MNIPDFLQELVEEGIDARITKAGFVLEGFYKSGEVVIKYDESNQGWYAHARYNEVTKIDDLQDLVALNYHWWMDYKDRGYSLDARWAPLLVRFGYVKKKIIPAQEVYE